MENYGIVIIVIMVNLKNDKFEGYGILEYNKNELFRSIKENLIKGKKWLWKREFIKKTENII